MKPLLTLLLVVGFATAALAQPRPTISIASPTNGTVVNPGIVTLTANAHDVDGFVAQVIYYINDFEDEPETQPPFFPHTINVSSGRYKIRARAIDNAGYSSAAISAPVYIQVGNDIPVNLMRGPYLQSCTTTSIVVRWRTDWPTNSVVRFGTSFPGTTFGVTNRVRSSEHEVLVAGLVPGTSYFYSVGSDTETFGVQPDRVFHTAPTNTRPLTVWVIGDSGTGTADEVAAEVRDAYIDADLLPITDLWLMLGDNAYEFGNDDEYQKAVFDFYPQILGSIPLLPTIGNHETEPANGPSEFPYLDIFTVPSNGAAGGIASQTKKYYSYDYANVHFVCLDSTSSSRAPNGAMATWLQADLAMTEKDWIVAYWHHPTYSFGTHNSDTELEMVQMRANILPILEAYGADLVLAGHNHYYQRSFLLNGHYGISTTLATNMVLDGTLGRAPNPYRKPAGGLGANLGTVYAVCGSSGQNGTGSAGIPVHPATALKTNRNGSMILRFDGMRMDAQFLSSSGVVDDYFTIDKSAPTTLRPELSLTRTMQSLALDWPTALPAFSLESTPVVPTIGPWQAVTNPVTRVGRRNIVNIGLDASNRFFRLHANP